MKKSKFFAAAFAATMFATAACGLVACDKDAGGTGDTGKKPQNTTYTVTFNAGSGTLSGAATLKTNAAGIVQGTVPTATLADNTFKGWALTSDAGESAVITFATQKFTKDTSVYAVYTPNGNGGNGDNNETTEYTITLNAGENGTCATPSLTTTNGKLASLPDATPNGGYVFDGWYTAASGGNRVTTDTTFTTDDTIYAQYTAEQEESDCEMLVDGVRKMYLTDNTANIVPPVEGNTATYEYMATGVALSAGEVVTFKVNGTVLTDGANGDRLWDTNTRHGVTFDQASGSFTVKPNAGDTFDIYVRYYNTGTDAENPCWSIEFTDGLTDTLVAGGVYLVGSGFDNASWNLATDNYIDPTEGLTVTLKAGDEFKACGCGEDGVSQAWDYNDPSKYKEVGGSNLNLSSIGGMSNGGVKSGSYTYKVTVENGIIVFTLIG